MLARQHVSTASQQHCVQVCLHLHEGVCETYAFFYWSSLLSQQCQISTDNLVGLAIGSVDGTNQTVVQDVLKVTMVLEPRTTSRDVVGGALALGLDEDRAVSGVLAIPGLEGHELLEMV